MKLPEQKTCTKFKIYIMNIDIRNSIDFWKVIFSGVIVFLFICSPRFIFRSILGTAGMRSHDKRMLEELNRTVCDHCSHILFVYHEDYKNNLSNENIKDNVHIVGNTIVEVCKPFIPTVTKRKDLILLDIHRPENFQSKNRIENII